MEQKRFSAPIGARFITLTLLVTSPLISGLVWSVESPPSIDPSDEQTDRESYVIESGDVASSFALVAFGRLLGGIYNHKGPSLRWSGGFGPEFRPLPELYVRAMVELITGPREMGSGQVISAWGIQPTIAVGYGWRFGIVHIGPILELGFSWNEVDIAIVGEDTMSDEWWNIRGAVGIDISLAFGDHLWFLFIPSLSGYPLRQVSRRESDNAVVYRTPYVDWNVLLGMLVFI